MFSPLKNKNTKQNHSHSTTRVPPPAPHRGLLIATLLSLLMTAAWATDDCNQNLLANGTRTMAYQCSEQTTQLASSALPQTRTKWIVLPEKAYPQTAPCSTAPKHNIALRYPATITEIASVPASDAPTSGPAWVAFNIKNDMLYLPIGLLVRKTPGWEPGDANLEIGKEIVDREIPLPLGYKATDLVKINQRWNYHGKDMPKWLRRDAAEAINLMLSEALKAGYDMQVSSSYRSAYSQRYLYLKKVGSSGLDQKLVAKPGHSEHQLGTTIDMCAPGKAGLDQSFGETAEGKWLLKNAPRFGFRHSYTKENTKKSGYLPEPWHIRYMGKPIKTPK